jgi:hypothetical protein
VARNERVIRASADAVFEILADPRGYAYWVAGSREIRDADGSWPTPGSRFKHTVNVGPLQVRDETKVEEMRPGRFLQLKARVRPFGSARVKLALEDVEDGTRVTMIEDPADAASAFLFTPLMHLVTRWRNVRSLARLAELAEGRVPMPGEEPEASSRTPDGDGIVVNPLLYGRADRGRGAAATIARGVAAGLAGAAAMSVSTNAEMRLRGRPPSDAPIRAFGRLPGVHARGKRRRRRVLVGGHLATSLTVGAARGVLELAGARPRPAAAAVFALALVPEVVVVPALGAVRPPWRWSRAEMAVTLLHHGVYAAAVNGASRLLRAG